MKPALAELRALAPAVDGDLAREHLQRLEDRYFELFSPLEVAEHLQAVAALSPDHPVEVLVRAGRPPAGFAEIDCTVIAFDYPGEFSIITGILGATGFNILSGDVFTWAEAAGGGEAGEAPGPADRRRRAAGLSRRRIIDHFSGRIAESQALELWEARLRGLLGDAVLLLERGGAQGLAKARQRVDELAAVHLSNLALRAESVLYPVHISVGAGADGRTLLRVVAQDTPLFLYALSTALALRSIFIDHIRIRTADNRIEDEFSFLDARGRRITDPAVLDQVKLSVLLTKQFTYFLGGAPDPYAALHRFEHLVESVQPEEGRWRELLSNPRVLQELARLLGASDYLWEDFIRLQYEALVPMLEPHVRGVSTLPDLLPRLLGEAVERAGSLPEKRRALNEFKDREIFLLELEYILDPSSDFQRLSRGLTRLAEAVVEAAVSLTWQDLVARHGRPRTVAGLTAEYAVLGLGKLGGGELGYASDIELLFLYSDQGQSEGSPPLSNAEFFEALVREAGASILAKKQGIFQIDLRLRPFGASGPAACSLDSFCWYYGAQGEAHSLERLALARLRAIAGSRELGSRVERIRDELLYSGKPLDLGELAEARQRQLDARTRAGELNAKASPGALRDLEWVILLLQIRYGRQHPELRTPFLREALERLPALGILSAEEAERLAGAYDFLRRLINGLRMLRGTAADLYLPALDSQEYVHLARRLGYASSGELAPAQRLRLEFETCTAAVRYAVERHLGRESLPDTASGNVADLILSEAIPLGERERILSRAGFRRPERAYRNLRALAAADDTGAFLRLAVLATDFLKHRPDPDMALNNWERFLAALRAAGGAGAAGEHFRGLAAQPRRLDILLAVFAGSQFLSDALIQRPAIFDWATQPEHLHRVRPRSEMLAAFRELGAGSRDEWLADLRRGRRREFVRLGIRDICLGAPIQEIMRELSMLAEAILQCAWERAAAEAGLAAQGLSILAFGKLGGEELNYSSDIDLLALAQADTSPEQLDGLGQAVLRLRADLSAHSEEGYVYRVDLRLRPYGRSGELVAGLEGALRYYRESAALWELQALLKARPVAGDLELGARFLTQARGRLQRPFPPAQVARSVAELRRASQARLARALPGGPDIKEGGGGIRDVEFLVQALQLIHAPAVPDGNTLAALEGLRAAGILPAAEAESLKRDYLFLRRIEHYLQIFEDRQTHTLPAEPAELDALARRTLGSEAGAERFAGELNACLARVQRAWRTHLPDPN
jgi:glutamate-ammonia-ligase adenylyltransferase